MENLRIWKEWAKYNRNGWLHKLLVLFGLAHSPTYEMHKALEPLRQIARDMRRYGWQEIYKGEKCGSKHANATPCNFCDNCGADMRGENE